MTVQRPQPTSPRLPRAARLQPDRAPVDDELTRLARRYEPRVVWWWSHRKVGRVNSIVCNLCGAVLVQGTGADRLSQRAADAVMLHRQHEIEFHGLTPGNDAGSTVAPADASPSGGSK